MKSVFFYESKTLVSKNQGFHQTFTEKMVFCSNSHKKSQKFKLCKKYNIEDHNS